MRHHFQDHRYGFGVSSPLWDAIMGTLPEAAQGALHLGSESAREAPTLIRWRDEALEAAGLTTAS